jgi:hypothetical protein
MCYSAVLLSTALQLREHEKGGHNKKADEPTAKLALKLRRSALDLTKPLSPARA